MNKRAIWYKAEEAVKNYLIDEWYQIIHQNYTIRWWEVDIVAEKDNDRIFVEVKEVRQTHDLHDYITPKKIQTLYRTIEHFNLEFPSKKNLRIDLVFTKDNNIIHYYQNISNN